MPQEDWIDLSEFMDAATVGKTFASFELCEFIRQQIWKPVQCTCQL